MITTITFSQRVPRDDTRNLRSRPITLAAVDFVFLSDPIVSYFIRGFHRVRLALLCTFFVRSWFPWIGFASAAMRFTRVFTCN